MSSLYYTAEEAAAVLGISINSLYAYVSRKRIRTQTVPGSKTSLYWHEDIDRLAKRGRETASPAAEANLVPSTAITLLTKEGPFYRGRSALGGSATLKRSMNWKVWAAIPAMVRSLPSERCFSASGTASSARRPTIATAWPFGWRAKS